MRTPVTLHCHTTYDSLDGLIKHEELVQFAKENGLEHIGIAQHGNFDGWVKFYKLCKKNNINPVIGYEAYMSTSVESKDVYHMVIIPRDFPELCKLFKLHNEFGIKENFYRKARILLPQLKELKNSFFLTGCLASILWQKKDKIDLLLPNFKKGLGDNLYLEIMPNSDPEQIEYNKLLVEKSAQYNIPLIVTTDSHYSSPEKAIAQKYMMAAATHTKVYELQYFSNPDFYLYTGDDIKMRMNYIDEKTLEEAVENTYRVASQVKLEIPIKLRLPKFKGEIKFWWEGK